MSIPELVHKDNRIRRKSRDRLGKRLCCSKPSDAYRKEVPVWSSILIKLRTTMSRGVHKLQEGLQEVGIAAIFTVASTCVHCGHIVIVATTSRGYLSAMSVARQLLQPRGL
eukprot:5809799-Amphidinium_carterae.1